MSDNWRNYLRPGERKKLASLEAERDQLDEMRRAVQTEIRKIADRCSKRMNYAKGKTNA